jgi:hypothetical protein
MDSKKNLHPAHSPQATANHETVTISLLNCSKESPVDRLQRLIGQWGEQFPAPCIPGQAHLTGRSAEFDTA